MFIKVTGRVDFRATCCFTFSSVYEVSLLTILVGRRDQCRPIGLCCRIVVVFVTLTAMLVWLKSLWLLPVWLYGICIEPIWTQSHYRLEGWYKPDTTTWCHMDWYGPRGWYGPHTATCYYMGLMQTWHSYMMSYGVDADPTQLHGVIWGLYRLDIATCYYMYMCFGMWYFGELTKFVLTAYNYGFRFFWYEREVPDLTSQHTPPPPEFSALANYDPYSDL